MNGKMLLTYKVTDLTSVSLKKVDQAAINVPASKPYITKGWVLSCDSFHGRNYQ
jgi:hypothetical protein